MLVLQYTAVDPGIGKGPSSAQQPRRSRRMAVGRRLSPSRRRCGADLFPADEPDADSSGLLLVGDVPQESVWSRTRTFAPCTCSVPAAPPR